MIEIIQSIFSNHNGMKLQINNRRKFGEFTKVWKLNTALLNNQWLKEVITRKINKHLEKKKTQHTLKKLKEVITRKISKLLEKKKTTYKIYGMQVR